MRVAIPINRPREENDLRVSSHFGKAYAFAVVDTESGEVKILPNPRNELKLSHGAGKFIADLLFREGVRAVLLREIGEGAFNHLKRFGMKIYLLPREIKTVNEAVEAFKKGELPVLEVPNEPPHEH